MRSFDRWALGLGLLWGLLMTGCGATPTDPQRTLADVVHDRRVALDALRRHPLAERQPDAFARAEQWLARVEAMSAERDPDAERLRLVLRTLEGQLVRIKATFARLDAEAALETRQAEYAAQLARIDAARRENAALRGDGLIEPLPMQPPERRETPGGGP